MTKLSVEHVKEEPHIYTEANVKSEGNFIDSMLYSHCFSNGFSKNKWPGN